MSRWRWIALVTLALTAIAVSGPIANDQIALEATRARIERQINADLPPGTPLDAAMDYLRHARYFPTFIGRSSLIDAARGYDEPAFPARVGRRIYVRGFLDSQQRVLRWDVVADRVFIPLP